MGQERVRRASKTSALEAKSEHDNNFDDSIKLGLFRINALIKWLSFDEKSVRLVHSRPNKHFVQTFWTEKLYALSVWLSAQQNGIFEISLISEQ